MNGEGARERRVEAAGSRAGAVAAYALPTARLIGSVVAAAVGFGAMAGVVVRVLLVRPDAIMAGLAGGATVAVVFGAMLALVRPGRVRAATAWPMLLFGAQGGVLLGSMVGGLLLYSATRLDPVGIGLAITAGFTAAVIAMALVFGAEARRYEPSLGTKAVPPTDV